MKDEWLHSYPCCNFETAYLAIRYSQSSDSAEGFIRDSTQTGEQRKYLYEASFRDEKWNIKITLADPENRNSFWDRDGPSKSIRTISGMRKNYRKDLQREISIKLDRFRSKIFAEENELRQLASQGQDISSPADRAR